MKQKRILVLGYFGYETNQLDGQTIKTRQMYRLVKEQMSDCRVDYFDTQRFKFNKLSPLKMLCKICRCDTLVYLPAHNNLKHIFPIVYVLSRIFGFKIEYFVVGGWLSEFLKPLPWHAAKLKKIAGIHAETQELVDALAREHGITNADTFPNFRFFDFTPHPEPHTGLRLVFMARVCRMKGLDWIFNLAAHIQQMEVRPDISISFYGPLNTEDKDYFEAEVAKYDFVDYFGPLQPDEIYETLNRYDMMLLPTHYFTEGLPGSLVDAFISGIPVTVSEWKHAHEFVEDNVCGYIIPFDDGQDALIERVMYLYEHPEELARLKSGALEKRTQYAPPDIRSLM